MNDFLRKKHSETTVETTLALDLEGTLISTAISVFPRPHLREFLEGCTNYFDRFVLYTSVAPERARAIAELLAREGDAPEWFADIEIVAWDRSRTVKDLQLVRYADLEATWLLDDQAVCVAEGQEERWIAAQEWLHPYPNDDTELLRILQWIEATFDKIERLEDDDVPIDAFIGEYRFLSNFYAAEIEIDGKTYPSVEHWYQANKAVDELHHDHVRSCKSPWKTKKRGRSLPEIRTDWDDVKVEILRRGIEAKFSRHPDLAAKLVATWPRELIEGNHWGDTFWGVDTSTGEGQNLLGKMLMEIRDRHRTGQA